MPFGGKRIASHWLKIISFEDGFLESLLLPVNTEPYLYHSLPCVEGKKKADDCSVIAKVSTVGWQLQRHFILTRGLLAPSAEYPGK